MVRKENFNKPLLKKNVYVSWIESLNPCNTQTEDYEFYAYKIISLESNGSNKNEKLMREIKKTKLMNILTSNI